jgi:hypothetical protein
MRMLGLYVAAAFLGAGLLFSVEPLIGRLVLPLLGGSPAVWNTCLLFFQGMLLAGYAYAHYGIRLLGIRRHAALHAGLVVVSLLLLPPSIGDPDPPVTGAPTLWLLVVLFKVVGVPFFVLSATAPLVQRWLAGSSHPAARDPYFLYAASNLGSLTGLILYPFVLEPLAGLSAQAEGWSVAYLLFSAVIATVALSTWARRPLSAAGQEKLGRPSRLTDAVPVGARTALRWTGTAFVPSALLLAVTAFITSDIAPMPLLWLLPLALYLLTFIVAFGGRGDRWLKRTRLLQPILTLLVGGSLVTGLHAMWMLPLHLAALTVVSYLGHGRLALERPAPVHLTAFYLWISVGGTLGGVFGVLVAPLLLMPETEYALLLLAALLLPAPGSETPELSARSVLVGVGAAAVLALVVYPLAGAAWAMAALLVPTLALWLRRIDTRPVGLLIGMTLFFASAAVVPARSRAGQELARERNFFGTVRVRESDGYRRLVHGRTMHGAQATGPQARETPTTYYAREGPLGDIFRLLGPRRTGAHIGVVGLGVGTAVCLGEPRDTWDLYEIDPAVVAIARDPRLFSFLQRCAPEAEMIIGDGRRTLEQRETARYDLLVLDAFTSDAIPVHLLTREAFDLYAARLAPGGLLAVHISNRYLDLAPVVASNAEGVGLTAWIRSDSGGGGVHHASSIWTLLSRDTDRTNALEEIDGWMRLPRSAGFRPWTDDYANLLSVLRILR